MRIIAFTILVLLMVKGTFAQKEGQQLVDSLYTELPKMKEDTNKVRLLAAISYEMSNIDAEEGQKLGEKALALAEKIDDPYGMGLSHLALNRCNYHLSKIPETVDHALKAKMIFESINDPYRLCEAYISLAVAFFLIDRELSRPYLTKASELTLVIQDQIQKEKTMSRVGNLFRWFGEWDSARAYLTAAIRIGEENHLNGEANLAKNRLAWLLDGEQKWDSAFLLIQQTTDYFNRIGQLKFYVEDLNLLALIRLNQSRQLPDFKHQYLEEAKNFALLGYESAAKIGYINEMFLAAQTLADIYRDQGLYEQAYQYLDSTFLYYQTMYSSEKLNKAAIASWKYEQEFKEQQLELLQLRNRQQLTLTIVAFSALAILILVVFFVINNRRKLKKAYNLVNQQKDEISRVLGKLETANLKLEGANKELEAFSYSVSHDLRAPVRRIEGLCEMLNEDYENQLDDAGKDLLTRITGSTVLMNTLIEDMLKLSKITRQSVTKAPCDISEMAKQICEDVRLNYPGKEVTCRIDEGIVVEADAHLMQIALQNLIDNAFKYSNKVEKPVVEVNGKMQNGKMVISVADNGVGFDMSQAEKLFTPFQRLHSDEEFKGTGVGLATVKRIIVKHGGTISVESETGKGTSFLFTV